MIDKDLAVEIEQKRDYVSRMADAEHVAALPVAFTLLYARLLHVARDCGYTLALHGSMRRDLDLIAVPWIEEAVTAEELVSRIMASSSSFGRKTESAVCKPHGRRCWILHLGGGPYIDLSVMPVAAGTSKE